MACREWSPAVSIAYGVNEAANFVYTLVSGSVNADELIAYNRAFRLDRRIRPGYRELFDAGAATSDQLDDAVIQQIIADETAEADFNQNAMTAIVVVDKEASRLGRLYEERQTVKSVVVFVSTATALRWLGYDGELPKTAPLPVARATPDE